MLNRFFEYEDVIDHNNTSVFFCNGKVNTSIGYIKEGTHFDFLLLNFEKMEVKVYIDNKVHVTDFNLTFSNSDKMYQKDDDSELDVSTEEDEEDEEEDDDEDDDDDEEDNV